MSEPTTVINNATSAPTTAPQIYVSIVNVMKHMANIGIPKSRKSDERGGGYAFRGIDQVMNTLASVMADNNMAALPSFTDHREVEHVTKGGTIMYVATVRGTFTLVSSLDGSTAQIATYGSAFDTGDKATNKAMAFAMKYALLQAFCVPTEKATNTPDGDASTMPPTETVLERLQREVSEANARGEIRASWERHKKTLQRAGLEAFAAGKEAVKLALTEMDKRDDDRAGANADNPL